MNRDNGLDLRVGGALYVERPCEVELRSLRVHGGQGERKDKKSRSH